MTHLSVAEFTLRLLTGLGCGAAIGIERQLRARMAGLRTNALVATGATLFVLYSQVDGSANSTQVAAYVVSGIGFLGGGVILRDGFNIRGLNTAATLWCSAALGVLAASGHYSFAVIGTGTVVMIHVFGRPLGHLLDPDNPGEEAEDFQRYALHIRCAADAEGHIRTLIVQNVTGAEAILSGLETIREPDQDETKLEARMLLGDKAVLQLERIISRLSVEPDIHTVHWHNLEVSADSQ